MHKTYLCTNVGDEAEAKAASGIWLKSMRTSLTCLLACAALSLVAACSDDGKSDGKGDVCADVTCSDHGTCEVKDGAAVCSCDEGYYANEGDATKCEADEPGTVEVTCDGIDCDGHGTCEVKEGAAVCSCDEGYHVKEGDATKCEADEPGNPGDKTCTDACEANILRCSGVNRERCLPDENQCLQWQTEVCEDNTHCDENTLQCEPNDSSDDPKTCTNPCESGAKRCIDNAVQICQADENGCYIWKIEEQCGIKKCDESSYTCVNVCTDSCTKGKKQCSGQNVQECKVSGSGCTEWVTVENCADKKLACNASNFTCDIPYVSPNNVDSFQIMYNWGIYASDLTETDVKNIKDAGFTLVPLSNHPGSSDDYDKYNAAMEKAIQLLDKENINVIVNDLSFQIIRWSTDWSESSTRPTKDRIASQIKFYSQFKNVVGFDVRDEPCLKDLDNIYNNLIKFISANSKEREIYINLFPDYVNVSGCCLQSEYSTYLSRYVGAFKGTKAKVLSVDYYPNNLRTSSQDALNEKRSFYEALNTIRTTAHKNNLIPMNISVSTEHDNFKKFDMREIAWQIASDIAHGMKRISYFTYSTMNDSSFKPTNMEMIDPTTKKPTKRYDEVKAINSILGPIGKEIYSKKIKDVTNIDSSCKGSLLTYDPAAKNCIYADAKAVDVMVDVNDSNAIVTTFDDDNTFLLTATSIENFNDTVFIFRWAFDSLQWYDYNSGTYKPIENGVLDKNGHQIYSAEIEPTSVGRQITFHVKSGYALLLRK